MSIHASGRGRVRTGACNGLLISIQPDAGIPATSSQKSLRILHFENVAQGSALVSGVIVVGFNDAIADPIAQITRVRQSAIVDPMRKLGRVFVRDKSRLNFLVASLAG